MAPVLIGTSAEKTVTGTGPQTLTFTEVARLLQPVVL